MTQETRQKAEAMVNETGYNPDSPGYEACVNGATEEIMTQETKHSKPPSCTYL